MRARQPFNVEEEMRAAWDRAWARNQEYPFRGRETYLTATDLEREVRDTLTARYYDGGGRGRRVMIQTGMPGGLLQAARRWLFAEVRAGRLVGNDMGRGHCSGERFRPVGVAAPAAETASTTRRLERRPPPRHAAVVAPKGERGFGRALCREGRPRNPFAYRRRHLWTTDNPAEVTCRQCAKRLRDMAGK